MGHLLPKVFRLLPGTRVFLSREDGYPGVGAGRHVFGLIVTGKRAKTSGTQVSPQPATMKRSATFAPHIKNRNTVKHNPYASSGAFVIVEFPKKIKNKITGEII